MNQKRIVFLFFALMMLSAIAGCGGDDLPKGPKLTFAHEGLSGRTITRLYEHTQHIYAATNRGIFRKHKTASVWQEVGLTTQEILDIAIISDQRLLASTYHLTNDETHHQLMESNDGGVSWSRVMHNFGGEEEEAIYALHYDSDQHRLYATGVEALAVSLDEGQNWDLLVGEWHGFGQRKAIINLHNTQQEIWYGGQNALEQLVLCAYALETEEHRCFPDLLPNPSVIYGIRFDPNNPERILASGEGGVIQSFNQGGDWTRLMSDVDYRFYFDIALDPHNSNIIYTAGWTKNWDTPQPLIFEVSTDGGDRWTAYRYPSNTLFGGVRSLLATREGDDTLVYLGLYRGGIMKVTIP